MTRKLVLCAVLGVLALAPAAAQAAPGNDTFIEATDFIVNGGRQTEDETATCPAGSRVVSGGVSTTGPAPEGSNIGPYAVMLSGPLDSSGLTANTDDGDVARHWYAAVHNTSASAQLFKVFALCSRTSDAVVEATPFTLPAIGSGGAVARCPAGSRAVGGGLNTTGPVGGQILTPILLSGPRDETGVTGATVNGDIPREWASSVFNLGSGPEFKAFALCSAQSDATLAIADLTVPGQSAGLATVRCPVDARVLGGGVHTLGPTPAGEGGNVPYFIMLSSPLDEGGTTANTLDGDEPRFWFAYLRNQDPAQRLFKVSAVCAPDDPQPGGGGGKQQPGGGGPGGGGPGGGGPGGGSGQRCDGKAATIVGTKRSDVLRGTRRNDVIVALGGNDRVLAGRGNDLVCAGSGNDRVDGGSGNDRLLGAAGKDTLLGAAGKDALIGGGGRDSLLGGPGADRERP